MSERTSGSSAPRRRDEQAERRTVEVWLNGERRALPDGSSVLDALAALGLPGAGVAVAVDGEVVRRVDWATAVLVEGARVEVLTAVQGG
jgi:sulfur carrier protein